MNSLLTMALALLISSGNDTLKRALTPPESWVDAMCEKTGADPATAIKERDEAADAWVAFIEDLSGVQAMPEVSADLGHDQAVIAPAPTATPPLNLNIIGLAVIFYRAFGKQFVIRALTPPASAIHAICEKSGADEAEATSARDRAVAELVEFVESLVEHDFQAA